MVCRVLWRCRAFVCASRFRNRKTNPLRNANEYLNIAVVSFCIYILDLLASASTVDSFLPGLFTGRVKSRGSGRVGSGQLTRPDPTRPARISRRLDPTPPDPRDFENLLTRPDPTRPDPTRPDPTRPARFEILLTRPDPTRHNSGDPRKGFMRVRST